MERGINFDKVVSALDDFWTNVDGHADNITRRLHFAPISFERHMKDVGGPIKITLHWDAGCPTFITLIATIIYICMIY